MLGDIFVKLYLYQFVICQCMDVLCFGFVWFQKLYGFGDWYLKDQNLIFGQWDFWYVMLGLDQCCLMCVLCYGDFGGFLEEFVDVDGVCGVICVLIDDFQYIFGDQCGCCDLYVVCVLVVRYWYFVVGEGYLIVWYGNFFQDGVMDYVFGVFVQIGEIVIVYVVFFLFVLGVFVWGILVCRCCISFSLV